MRPTWEEYFMGMVELVKSRSTCLRRQVGAIIVKDKRILATGYNGAPIGCKHCAEVGCIRQQMNIPSGERHELCRAIHAEQNAIVQAAYSGTSIAGATIYSSLTPCSLCAKLIINAGIVKVVCRGEYADSIALSMLEEAGVEVVNLDKIDMTSENSTFKNISDYYCAINERSDYALATKFGGLEQPMNLIVTKSPVLMQQIVNIVLLKHNDPFGAIGMSETYQIMKVKDAKDFIQRHRLFPLEVNSMNEYVNLGG